MKIFLLGDIYANAGPSNVNRALVSNADESLTYVKSSNRIYKRIEILGKSILADVIVVSGVPTMMRQKLLKIVNPRAPKLYLMHGNLRYENNVNHLHLDPQILRSESVFMEQCDAIVCVSEQYAKWVAHNFPQFSNKITFVNNGLDISPREKIKKKPMTIAVGGGNRCQKNNIEVCKAVERLRNKGLQCELYIFGRNYPDNDDFSVFPFAKFMGQMSPSEYYEKLDEISLFVVASEVESFGLVVGDALNCRCSLLQSQNVGAVSIMETYECDLISDPHNIDVLAEKIEYLLYHSNADRILQSVDVEACSAKQSYLRLKRICEEVEKQ